MRPHHANPATDPAHFTGVMLARLAEARRARAEERTLHFTLAMSLAAVAAEEIALCEGRALYVFPGAEPVPVYGDPWGRLNLRQIDMWELA